MCRLGSTLLVTATLAGLVKTEDGLVRIAVLPLIAVSAGIVSGEAVGVGKWLEPSVRCSISRLLALLRRCRSIFNDFLSTRSQRSRSFYQSFPHSIIVPFVSLLCHRRLLLIFCRCPYNFLLYFTAHQLELHPETPQASLFFRSFYSGSFSVPLRFLTQGKLYALRRDTVTHYTSH